jgi:benzoyl-CoA reductase subunit C
MSALQALLGTAEDLYRDLRFTAVRDWKQRTGGLAVGFMPVYVPREILHAMGILPVGVMGAGDDLEIIRGDAYYQSYICHLPRSTIELGLNGALDCLDGLLFPATCDVIRNLSGMWLMQFPGKYVHYLDVPQDFSPEVGGAFYRHELEQICEALQARGARPLTAAALRASIALYNENRALVEGLYTLRMREPWRVPTHELYLLLRAGCVLPVEQHSAMLRDYTTCVQQADDRRPMDQARVLLAGSFCEQPPLGLIKTLERAGCYIVDDDFVQVHRWIRGDVRADGDDPLQDLVVAYLRQGIESPIRYIDQGKKGQDLVDRVQRSGAEGVIFCAPSFCDPALLDQPMAVAAMDRAGIPWTAFKYAENTGQFQVIREQAGTFADSIKLWSE